MGGNHEDLNHGTKQEKHKHYQVVDLAADGHLETHEADDKRRGYKVGQQWNTEYLIDILAEVDQALVIRHRRLEELQIVLEWANARNMTLDVSGKPDEVHHHQSDQGAH